MNMNRIIALYMDDCHSRQLRPKTMQSYEQALKLFATWLEERHEITQVEAVKDIHIRSCITDLQARGKYTFCADRQSEQFNHPQNRRDYQAKISNSTINNYLRNMRAFFKWLVEVEYIARSPMSKIKLLPDERQAREYLEDNEAVKLLKSLDKSFYPEYRDYVLMLDSGTRVGETLTAENANWIYMHGVSTSRRIRRREGEQGRYSFPPKQHGNCGIGCNTRAGIAIRIICSQ